MIMTEAQAGVYQEIETNLIDRWPKKLEGFLKVIMDNQNPLFEEMARVIESPDCRRVLSQYVVRKFNGEKFCPISRRPKEVREWVAKMREKRNEHGS